MVLGATVVNRWFQTHRGLIMGLLTASTAPARWIFLPALASIAQRLGWQAVVWAMAACAAALMPLIWRWLPERPADIGLSRYGASVAATPEAPGGNPITAALAALSQAMRHRQFWLLFGTFAICGFTTNGLIGMHLIALCGDHGIPEVRAASLLAAMGICDLIGTTLSGWLTDRFDSRKLLCLITRCAGCP